MKEKVKTMVPVVITGEAQAVTDKVGLLLQNISEVEVEALPDKLPEHIEVNVEKLAQIGDQITIADVQAPEDVTILTDAAQTVVKIVELTVAEPEPEEEAPAEGEEGAEATEGEATSETEEKPAEEATQEEHKE